MQTQQTVIKHIQIFRIPAPFCNSWLKNVKKSASHFMDTILGDWGLAGQAVIHASQSRSALYLEFLSDTCLLRHLLCCNWLGIWPRKSIDMSLLKQLIKNL